MTDEEWMELALQEAEKAIEANEIPIGAVAVKDGTLLARDHNRSIGLTDPTAHAEILVLRDSARKIGNYRLCGVRLYVTVEPCPMCAGALIWSRVKSLIYGADEAKAGCVISRTRLLEPGLFNHDVRVRGGILADRSRQLLRRFFEERRKPET